MKIRYRDEFGEQIRNLNNQYTTTYCLERLIYAVENTCSLTDLERILEEYKLQIEE